MTVIGQSEEAFKKLKSLHVNAIDAKNGYEEALKDADGRGLTHLFAKMITLHTQHADELARLLRESGEAADEDGSFMSVVHRSIMSVRSLFDGLDESVLPGLIDGETRNADSYSEALQQSDVPEAWADVLRTQQNDLLEAIASMRAESAKAAS
jgi:uncharacterized protein (TIGR02284 family)